MRRLAGDGGGHVTGRSGAFITIPCLVGCVDLAVCEVTTRKDEPAGIVRAYLRPVYLCSTRL